MGEPQAIQVFHFDQDKKLILNNQIFKILTHRKIKDKDVCIISIAGAFRQGKSFIINFLLRYLELKYKGKRKNMTNWLNSDDGPISGFSWQAGSEPHTAGILMWPEIFLAKLPSKKEVAIILMDTQGSFDNARTVQESAIIFALSVLMSSVQIYNLKENIKQYDLQHLQFFSDYGKMVVDNSDNPDTFQKLIFLVRDWQCSYEKNYGFEGGENLLEEVLSTRDNPQQLVDLKNGIKAMFEEINCCLLPHPGRDVACSNLFWGNVDEIDLEFKNQVQVFVDRLLSPEKLKLKKVNDQTLKASDLVTLIQTYWRHFSDGDIPTLSTVFEATVEIQHQTAMRESEETYKTLMQNCRESKKASEIMSHVIDEFVKRKKMGTASTKQEYKNLLTQKLDQLYIDNYKVAIEEYESRMGPRVVKAGATTAAVGGGTAATTMVLAGIGASATAGEIALVATVTGLGAAATGFVVGALALAVFEGVRWSVKTWKKKNQGSDCGDSLGGDEGDYHVGHESGNENDGINENEVEYVGHREIIDEQPSTRQRAKHESHETVARVSFSFVFNDWVIAAVVGVLVVSWLMQY